MQRTERNLRLTIFFSMLIIFIVGGILVTIIVNIQTDEIQRFIEENTTLPLLIFIENEGELLISQLVFFELDVQAMAVFDIPTRLGAIIPSLGRVDRIDNYYFEFGAERVREILERIFQIDLPYFTVLNVKNLEIIVDLVEGIPVILPEPIDYISAESIATRLPAGNSRLDGEKILSMLQYIGPEEREIEWVSRRWNFTQELFRAIRDNTHISENTDYFSHFANNFNLNVNDRGLRSFLSILSQIKFTNILTQRILGNDREVLTDSAEEIILFPHFDGEVIRDSIRQISRNLESLNSASNSSFEYRLEILNGTAINGLAARTRDLFQNFGYNIVRIANADEITEHTLIVDRTNSREPVQAIGSIIRAQRFADAERLAEFPQVDVTIILGRDFDGLYVQANEEE